MMLISLIVVMTRCMGRLRALQAEATANATHAGPLTWETDLWPVLCRSLGGKPAELHEAVLRLEEELPLCSGEAKLPGLDAERNSLATALDQAIGEWERGLAQSCNHLSLQRVRALASELSLPSDAAPAGRDAGMEIVAAPATAVDFHARAGAAVSARCSKLRVGVSQLEPVCYDGGRHHDLLPPVEPSLVAMWRGLQLSRDLWAARQLRLRPETANSGSGSGVAASTEGAAGDNDAVEGGALPPSLRPLPSCLRVVCRRKDLTAPEAAALALPVELTAHLVPSAAPPAQVEAAAAGQVHLLLRDMALSPRTADPAGVSTIAGSSCTVYLEETIRGTGIDSLAHAHGAATPAEPFARHLVSEAVAWAVDLLDQCRGMAASVPQDSTSPSSAAETAFVVSDGGLRVTAVGLGRSPLGVASAAAAAAHNCCLAIAQLQLLLHRLFDQPTASDASERSPSGGWRRVKGGKTRTTTLRVSAGKAGAAPQGLPDSAWVAVGDIVVIEGATGVTVLSGGADTLQELPEETATATASARVSCALPGVCTLAVRAEDGGRPAVVRVHVAPAGASRWLELVRAVVALGDAAMLRRLNASLQAQPVDPDDVCESFAAWLARQA